MVQTGDAGDRLPTMRQGLAAVLESPACKWLRRALLVALVGWVVAPLLWILSNSVRPTIYVRSARAIPFLQFQPTLDHWRRWLRDDRLLRSAADSTIVALASTWIALALGCPAGYALARYRYERWKNADLVLFFLSQRMLPPIVAVLPFYVMSRWSGTFDSRTLLSVVHATFHLPLIVLLMFLRFRELPTSLEESAFVEGCNVPRYFLAMALPITAPFVAICALLAFSFSWNEFLFSLLLTSGNVLPVARLIQSAAENDWGVQLDAVSVIGLLAVAPPTLFGLASFWLLSRQAKKGRRCG